MRLPRFLKRRLNAMTVSCTFMPYWWVSSEPAAFFKRISRFTVVKKHLHRRLVMARQSRREVFRIEPNQRVLWIYYGKHAIGDAIMELSGRALLRDRPGPVDLLTTSSLKTLFDGDDVFRHIYEGLDRIDPDDYDVILTHEFNYPTMRLKKRRFRNTPFASLFRYCVAGPGRNSTQSSFAAVNKVFNLGLHVQTLSAVARPYLREEPDLPRELAAELMPLGPFLTIGVGGVEPRRTYAHWEACLQAYDNAFQPGMPGGVVLLDSGNGLADARALMKSGRYTNLKLVSLVGELGLRDAKRVIANSELYVGADGGLMHVAHATPTPSVALFAADEPAHLRLTPRCRSIALQTRSDVSAVDPRELAQSIVDSLGNR